MFSARFPCFLISGVSSIFKIDAGTGVVSVKAGATYDGQYTSLRVIAVDDSSTNQLTGTGYVSVCAGKNCCSQSSAALKKPSHTVVFALQVFIVFSLKELGSQI